MSAMTENRGLVNLETALRSALAKGDETDPSFRRQVYTAAANAMERSMSKKAGITDEAIVVQRQRLATVIASVEADVRLDPPPTPPELEPEEPSPPPLPTLPVNGFEHKDPPAELEIASVEEEPKPTESDDEPRLYVEPRADDDRKSTDGKLPQSLPELLKAGKIETIKRSALGSPALGWRRPFATGFILVILLSAIVATIVWLWSTGALQSTDERDTSVPNPPLVLEEESSSGPATLQNEPQASDPDNLPANPQDWVTLFEPSNLTTLGLGGGASATVETDPFGDYARLLTPLPGGEVQIDVPIRLLDRLSGQRVQVSLQARSDEGLLTEMSVVCDFAELGDCGRRRFRVGQSPANFIFYVDLPNTGRLSRPGLIKIRTDIEAGTRAVNLLSARIRSVSR